MNMPEAWSIPMSQYKMYTMEYADPDINGEFSGSFTFILPAWFDIGFELDKIIHYTSLSYKQEEFVNTLLKKDGVDIENEHYHLNCHISFGMTELVDLAYKEIIKLFDVDGDLK